MKYFKFPKFPNLPDYFIEELMEPSGFHKQYENIKEDKPIYQIFSLPKHIDLWLKIHVCDSDWVLDRAYTGNKIHIDKNSIIKLVYPIKLGGKIRTVFYDDNKNELESHYLKERQWCMFRTDLWHFPLTENTYDGRMLLHTCLFKRDVPLSDDVRFRD